MFKSSALSMLTTMKGFVEDVMYFYQGKMPILGRDSE